MKHGPIALLDERHAGRRASRPTRRCSTRSSRTCRRSRARGAHVIAVADRGRRRDRRSTPSRCCACPRSTGCSSRCSAVDPAAAAGLRDRAQARPERRPAAQPRQDRHGRVSGGVGLDLLEIERLERALERRPGWPSACSPTPSARTRRRARAARPAPRGALLRQGGGREGARAARPGAGRTSRSPAGGEDAEVVLHGDCGRAPASSACASRVSLTHTRHDGRRRGGPAVSARRPGSTPLPDAEAMRATDRWAIEERGIPSLELMERAGAGLAALVAERRAGRAGRGRLRQGQQRRRRAGRGAAAARARAARCACCCSATRDELRGDAAANLRACAGATPSRSTPARSTAPRSSSTRCSAPASTGEPRGRRATRSRRWTRCERAVVAADVPSGVDASTGEVAGRRGPRARDRDVPRGQARAVDRTRARRTPATVRVIDIGIPRGRAGASRGRPDRRRACSREIPRRGARARRSSAPATCSSAAARAA